MKRKFKALKVTGRFPGEAFPLRLFDFISPQGAHKVLVRGRIRFQLTLGCKFPANMFGGGLDHKKWPAAPAI